MEVNIFKTKFMVTKCAKHNQQSHALKYFFFKFSFNYLILEFIDMTDTPSLSHPPPSTSGLVQ